MTKSSNTIGSLQKPPKARGFPLVLGNGRRMSLFLMLGPKLPLGTQRNTISKETVPPASASTANVSSQRKAIPPWEGVMACLWSDHLS